MTCLMSAMETICLTKIAYLSKGAAYEALAKINSCMKQRKEKRRTRNYVYHCTVCRRYHLSRSKDRLKL